MVNVNHLTGDPEEVRKRCKFQKIKSQSQQLMAKRFFLVEIKAKVFHKVSKVQNIFCIRNEYMSFSW